MEAINFVFLPRTLFLLYHSVACSYDKSQFTISFLKVHILRSFLCTTFLSWESSVMFIFHEIIKAIISGLSFPTTSIVVILSRIGDSVLTLPQSSDSIISASLTQAFCFISLYWTNFIRFVYQSQIHKTLSSFQNRYLLYKHIFLQFIMCTDSFYDSLFYVFIIRPWTNSSPKVLSGRIKNVTVWISISIRPSLYLTWLSRLQSTASSVTLLSSSSLDWLRQNVSGYTFVQNPVKGLIFSLFSSKYPFKLPWRIQIWKGSCTMVASIFKLHHYKEKLPFPQYYESVVI